MHWAKERLNALGKGWQYWSGVSSFEKRDSLNYKTSSLVQLNACTFSYSYAVIYFLSFHYCGTSLIIFKTLGLKLKHKCHIFPVTNMENGGKEKSNVDYKCKTYI